MLWPGAGLPRSRKFDVGSAPGAKSLNNRAAMLFGRVCSTKRRNSGVSTENSDPRAPDCRSPSYDEKKNTRLRTMGPPIEYPNWFLLNAGTDVSNTFFAESLSFWK